jgi:hypothetical protein
VANDEGQQVVIDRADQKGLYALQPPWFDLPKRRYFSVNLDRKGTNSPQTEDIGKVSTYSDVVECSPVLQFLKKYLWSAGKAGCEC